VLLWLGERDSRVRLDSPIVLHDVVAYISVSLLAGHLYLAVIHPSTRHALRGMTVGTVREDWAREHHAKWPTDAQ
jgi:formate dehydrogenase subunit gamma